MSATVVLTEAVYEELLGLACAPVESAAVLLAHVVGSHPARPRLVVTAVHHVDEDAYLTRDHKQLEITSEGYMHALAVAAQTGTTAIWIHTHPGAGSCVSSSEHDDIVNEQLRQVFALRTGSGAYTWLVLGHDGARLTFTGAHESDTGAWVQVTRLNAIGASIRRLSAQDAEDDGVPDLFDRNIRALGTEVQKVITEMVFVVVGCGGTGSAVAEQLVRLGARHLILIDPDVLSETNTTRVYGSTADDVGRPKVDVLGDHLGRIAPSLSLTRIQDTVNTEGTARALLDADVVFGCTDDNAGRLRLSRLPYYYRVPVIDCGVKLDSDAEDIINGIFGRITVLHPGTACLLCRERVDIQLAAAELRDPDEQRRLEGEHYAPALPGVEPALVAFTTMVAAYAVSELIERLIGYGESPTPSELLLRVHDRTVSANVEDPSPGHYCDPATPPEHDPDMFLGLNWTA